MVVVISKRASVMSGITSYTYSNQYPFQEGRCVIVVAAIFDTSIDWIPINHIVEAYSNLEYHRDYDYVHRHRVHWDPGGWQWSRLGVKPSFKKGGMSGAYCNLHVHGLAPFDSTWAGPGVHATSSDACYKYHRRSQRTDYPGLDQKRQRRPPLPLYFLLPPSPISVAELNLPVME